MNNINKLLDFISASVTPYHTVKATADVLEMRGFERLSEQDAWSLADGGLYYVIRGGSLIAFKHRSETRSFNIVSAHTDFPAFKVKTGADRAGDYTRLATESYGGAINYTWFDRALSVGGRVYVKTETGAEMRLVDLARPLAVIPSVAPHLSREINSSFGPNLATDLRPLYSLDGGCSVISEVARALGVDEDDILAHDLYLYNPDRGTVFGGDGSLLLAPRIDDLASVYTALDAFIEAKDSAATPILALFNNEEVGSSTREGAASHFLADTVKRICGSEEVYRLALASSVMLSSDGAHAMHPNHPELSDPVCHPVLGGGVVVKYNSNRRYATEAESLAPLAFIAKRCGVKLQSYANRADLPGGSTLGSIASTKLPVLTVDIGIAQLAMHSVMETCAVSDIEAMTELLEAFYSAEISNTGDGFSVK
jgi:aspartyl aminopeptidase